MNNTSYNEYISAQLNTSISYNEYICEQIDNDINYVDYINSQIDPNWKTNKRNKIIDEILNDNYEL